MVPRKLVERSVGLLPILLIPVVIAPVLVVLMLMLQPETYRSWAAVWVSNSEMATSPLGGENVQATPAGRQQQVMGELLTTQQFTESVAIHAGWLVPRPDGGSGDELLRRRAADLVRRSVGVSAAGFNLLSVSAQGRTAEEARSLNAAVIATFEERLSAETNRRDQTALEYFRQQLEVADAELTARRSELTAYLAQHPNAADQNVVDVEYDALADRLRSQRLIVSDLQRSFQGAQLDAVTASQRQSAFFRVEDEPTLPLLPNSPGIVTLAGYPIAGMAFGAIVSIVYLYVVYRSDHTVRSGEDVVPTGLTMLGIVPELNSKQYVPWYRRIGRKQRDFARRVALQAAGATPPERAAS